MIPEQSGSTWIYRRPHALANANTLALAANAGNYTAHISQNGGLDCTKLGVLGLEKYI